jgi:hypothetical protein
VQEPFFTTVEVQLRDYSSKMHRWRFMKLGAQSKYKSLKAGDRMRMKIIKIVKHFQ